MKLMCRIEPIILPAGRGRSRAIFPLCFARTPVTYCSGTDMHGSSKSARSQWHFIFEYYDSIAYESGVAQIDSCHVTRPKGH